MGNKDKEFRSKPNAPEQVLWKQPPHNPYYPDLGATLQLLSPPPYPSQPQQLPMTNMASPSSNANYSRLAGQQQHTVVMRHPIQVSSRREKYLRDMRTFNNELIVTALIAVLASVFAYSLYDKRPCLNFVVQKWSPEVSIGIYDVRDYHLTIAWGSAFVLLIGIIKFMSGRYDSQCCYKFVVALATLALTLFCAYLTFLAFYSPCSTKINELLVNTANTIMSKLVPNEGGVFKDSNVIQLANEDKFGLMIFAIDIVVLILYIAKFCGTLFLC